MAKRRKVGIVYQYQENWIGGTYYIQNLISAINTLGDDEKFELIIYTEDDDHYRSLSQITKYPYLQHGTSRVNLNIVQRGINKIFRLVGLKEVFNTLSGDKIAVFFPAQDKYRFKNNPIRLYWIPDFQDLHMPHLFTKEELDWRRTWHESLVANHSNIVFSSVDALKDFDTFFPENNANKYVLNFAVTHPVLHFHDREILTKFNIDYKYFICCNQFWVHKNHKVVLQALSLLKNRDIHVVFTGKQHDHRNPAYFEELQNIISDSGISDSVTFLGFIKREDQLSLMNFSEAIIQPSFFEGWSTVIEDAKSLNKPVIASGLDVHYEQLEFYREKRFFNPESAEELSVILEQANFSGDYRYDYKKDIEKYAKNFVGAVDDIIYKNKNFRKKG